MRVWNSLIGDPVVNSGQLSDPFAFFVSDVLFLLGFELFIPLLLQLVPVLSFPHLPLIAIFEDASLCLSPFLLLFPVDHQVLESLFVDGEVAIFCLLLLLLTESAFAIDLLLVVLKDRLVSTLLKLLKLAVLLRGIEDVHGLNKNYLYRTILIDTG